VTPVNKGRVQVWSSTLIILSAVIFQRFSPHSNLKTMTFIALILVATFLIILSLRKSGIWRPSGRHFVGGHTA
jgi:hypothetical protein